MAQSISQQQQQQLMRENWLAASASSAQMMNPSNLNRSTSVPNERRGTETIHSGHFMVSHFEAEAQDDEDTEIEMPDPDENAIIDLNPCTNVQLMSTSSASTSTAIVPVNSKANSSAVIDISLAKLFKCMNLAYRLETVLYFFFPFRFPTVIFSIPLESKKNSQSVINYRV